MIENKKANKPMERKEICSKDFVNKFVKQYENNKDDVRRFISTLITRVVVLAYNYKVNDSLKFRELVVAKIGFNTDNYEAGVKIEFIFFVEDMYGNISFAPGFGFFGFYQIDSMIDVEILQDGKAITFGKTWADCVDELDDKSEDEQEHGN